MIKRVWQFAAWPAAIGTIIALLFLLFLPQLRDKSSSAITINSGSINSQIGPVSYADAVSRAAPAVVNVYSEKRVEQRHPLENHPLFRLLLGNSNNLQQARLQNTLGSGVIVDDQQGFILTNKHVINGADKIFVLLNDGRGAAAELVGTDPQNDLAVLKIVLDNLASIPIGNPNKIRVGDVVLAIGNPFGVGQSVSQGIVSATGRWNLGINSAEDFIQTDAAINPGNSGGALVDAYGNLIGINTAILDETGASVGVSFAVPADKAMNSLQQIVQYGTVRRGWLGLSVVSLPKEELTKLGGVSGLMITAIDANSPAQKAGFQIKDLITHIDGIALRDQQSLTNSLNNIQPNAVTQIRVVRAGKSIEITATAAFPPQNPPK